MVQTNHPGPGPNGAAIYLSGQEAIKHMTTPKGIKINLWASEEQFPELIKPVQMAWDTKGRLWVASWRTYPERTPDRQGRRQHPHLRRSRQRRARDESHSLH